MSGYRKPTKLKYQVVEKIAKVGCNRCNCTWNERRLVMKGLTTEPIMIYDYCDNCMSPPEKIKEINREVNRMFHG